MRLETVGDVGMTITPADHPVFREFEPWHGHAPGGYEVTFLNERIDISRHAHWQNDERRYDRCSYPPYPASNNPDIFEWLTLLTGVLEAHGRFIMVELGAGYGRWLVAGACAIRRRRPELKVCLVGVEGDPTHYAWMQEHFRDNNIDPTEHRLVHGAVAAADGEATFVIGPDPSAWYGQSLVTSTGRNDAWYPKEQIIRVPTYSINTLLADLDHVDVFDCDIQGEERNAIPAGIEVMTKKVKRAFVETHAPEIDELLERTFSQHGWKPEYSYACFAQVETEFGAIKFDTGGAQCWFNPALV